MARPFLTAQWSNLCLLNYAVDPALLADRLPPGLEIDRRDGEAFVSLVAFEFLRTRVLGVRWPGLINFPEINLRFYVRDRARRGVCFIREFVPSRITAWAARTLYNEPYSAAKMTSRATADGDRLDVEHTLVFNGKMGRLRVRASGDPFEPAPESVEAFFKEHSWGFGRDRAGRLATYRVDHPVWKTRAARVHALDWDWAGLYGPEWGVLRDARPASVHYAVGSRVQVFPRGG